MSPRQPIGKQAAAGYSTGAGDLGRYEQCLDAFRWKTVQERPEAVVTLHGQDTVNRVEVEEDGMSQRGHIHGCLPRFRPSGYQILVFLGVWRDYPTVVKHLLLVLKSVHSILMKEV